MPDTLLILSNAVRGSVYKVHAGDSTFLVPNLYNIKSHINNSITLDPK